MIEWYKSLVVDSRGRRSNLKLGAFQLQRAGVVYAFLVIVVALEIFTLAGDAPEYLSDGNIRNVLDQASFVAILSVFMTVVLISGNFDLSVASVAAFSSALALTLLDEHGVVVAALLALLCGAAVGLLNGILVVIVGVNAFIVTLGTLTGVRGLVLILTNGRTVQAHGSAFLTFEEGLWAMSQAIGVVIGLLLLGAAAIRMRRARGIPVAARISDIGNVALLTCGLLLILVAAFRPALLQLTHPVWFLIGLTALTGFILRFTIVGRRLYAVGSNAEAARLSGIKVTRYQLIVFVLNGLVAAFVGLLYAGKFGAVNGDALNGTELTVLAAAILGGTSLFGGSGSVLKSVVGALILFTLANGFNILNLGSTYQGLVQGIVIIAAASIYAVASRGRRA